jgi:hypothetical protein
MTVQDLARLAIDVRSEDEEALRRSAEIEDQVFEAYMSDYNVVARICKSCHEPSEAA